MSLWLVPFPADARVLSARRRPARRRVVLRPKLDGWRVMVTVDAAAACLAEAGVIHRMCARACEAAEALRGHEVVLDGELIAVEGRACDCHKVAPRVAASPGGRTVTRQRPLSPPARRAELACSTTIAGNCGASERGMTSTLKKPPFSLDQSTQPWGQPGSPRTGQGLPLAGQGLLLVRRVTRIATVNS